jgi:hypothetical protein
MTAARGVLGGKQSRPQIVMIGHGQAVHSSFDGGFHMAGDQVVRTWTEDFFADGVRVKIRADSQHLSIYLSI